MAKFCCVRPETDRVPLPKDAMSSTSRGEAWSLAEGSRWIQDSIRSALQSQMQLHLCWQRCQTIKGWNPAVNKRGKKGTFRTPQRSLASPINKMAATTRTHQSGKMPKSWKVHQAPNLWKVRTHLACHLPGEKHHMLAMEVGQWKKPAGMVKQRQCITRIKSQDIKLCFVRCHSRCDLSQDPPRILFEEMRWQWNCLRWNDPWKCQSRKIVAKHT